MLIFSSFGISSALIGMGVYFHFKSLEKQICTTILDEDGNVTVQSITTTIDNVTKAAEEEFCKAIYTHSIRWLPLLLLMVYIFFFNLGYGAMIWITVVEILPLHVRSVATSLSVGFTCICSFLTSHTYSYLKETISVEGVFWLYGSVSFLGLIFIMIFVPETKGKNEAQLMAYFAKKKKINVKTTKDLSNPMHP